MRPLLRRREIDRKRSVWTLPDSLPSMPSGDRGGCWWAGSNGERRCGATRRARMLVHPNLAVGLERRRRRPAAEEEDGDVHGQRALVSSEQREALN